MKVLFLGDVVGGPGRRALPKVLAQLTERHRPDFVVANGENAAGGLGLTPDTANEILAAGVDVVTSGNHVWKKKEVVGLLQAERRVIRPANYPRGTPGSGSVIARDRAGRRLGVLNLEGRVFMNHIDCPFRAADEEIQALCRETKAIIVDFHAEATSEKRAMGFYLDGRVSAVLGTHTHVQTADEQILPRGTAYITDVGMSGPTNSVIGVRKELVIERFLTCRPISFQLGAEDVQVQGVVVEIDDDQGRAVSIQRFVEKAPNVGGKD